MPHIEPIRAAPRPSWLRHPVQRYTKMKRSRQVIWVMAFFIVMLLIVTAIYHTYKPLPSGISFEGQLHNQGQVEFFYNAQYSVDGEQIFKDAVYQAWYETIHEAEQFIVLDMFMLNGFHEASQSFPSLSGDITELIIQQMNEHPDLQVYVISDPVNTTYGSHEAPKLEQLRNAGAVIVITKTKRLRDSNPIYSAVWRMFIQWFGQSGEGWLSNPFANTAPEVTLRSYAKLLNVKANHRKVLLTEKAGIVASANMHDASYYHGNIAFRLKGPILQDILEAEKAVMRFSGTNPPAWTVNGNNEDSSEDVRMKWVTEGKIQQTAKAMLDQAKAGDVLWMGMFYLADRNIVEGLLAAEKRGTRVRIIMDPNQTAFGHQKMGLPNRPVAAELLERSGDQLQLRWYDVDKEQYHTKMMMLKQPDRTSILGGSANYTSRNLNNFNLEANVYLEAESNAKVAQDVEQYFQRLWNNEDGTYTASYEKYDEKIPFLKMAFYTVQKLFKFTTY